MTIDELRALGERATDGPWTLKRHVDSGEFGDYTVTSVEPDVVPVQDLSDESAGGGLYGGIWGDADAEFIAAARNQWDALLRVVGVAREEHYLNAHTDECICGDPECFMLAALDALTPKEDATSEQ